LEKGDKMREFINKNECIYDENIEKYYKEEEKYVNSSEVLNESDYLDFNKLKFLTTYKIIPEENSEDLEECGRLLNEEQLIEEFANNFLQTFPNIYTKITG